MARERHILERAVRVVAEQARRADDLVDLANPTSGREDVILHAKVLRLELLKVKADLSASSPRSRRTGGLRARRRPGSRSGSPDRTLEPRRAGAAR